MQINTDKKALGAGFMGTVYKCKYNGVDAILKMEKYLPSEPQFERQMHFDNLVARKHPDRFLQLLHAGIINGCMYDKFKPKYPKDLNKLIKKRIADLKASKQCNVLIYAPVLKYTLASVIEKLSIDMRKAIYIHLRKSLDIMHSANYTHNDIHVFNIMCSKPNDPSSYYFIDYGTVINKSDKKSYPADKLTEKYADDDTNLCWSFIYDDAMIYMFKNHKEVHVDIMYKAVNRLISGSMHNEVKCFILYCKQYSKYLEILGCTNDMISNAKQDPLASYLLRSLLNHKNE